MINMVKVSVIMPVYNGEKFLKKTIDSLNSQTLKDLELICVDDGSKDNSLEVLKNLKKQYNFIKIFSQNNQGSGQARNTGMEKATGEYIAFLDADDVFLDSSALETMYNFGVDYEANVVSANLQFIEKDYKLKANWHYHNKDYAYFDSYSSISPKNYGIPYAFYKNIFKRSFLLNNDIKFPDLIRGQDPIFLAKILAKTNKIYTVPLNLYGYNYSIGGGVNVKVNNYEKKFSYLKHFKETCDVLKEGNLIDCYNEYKIHTINYLSWRDNIYDIELYDIYDKIYGGLPNYFDKSNVNFLQFYILKSFYFIINSNDNNDFLDIKNEFLKLKYSPNDIISEKLNMVINSSSIDEVKLAYSKSPIKQWNIDFNLLDETSAIKQNENNSFEEHVDKNRELINQNKELINQNRELINQNKELIKQNKNSFNDEIIMRNRETINKNRELINKNRESLNKK